MDCITIKTQLVREAPTTIVKTVKDSIQTNVSTLSNGISSSIETIKESIKTTVTTAPKQLKSNVTPIKTKINMLVKLICTANYLEVIEWAKSVLQWDSEDNVVGTIKYNTLIASDDWTIEEVTIEELL